MPNALAVLDAIPQSTQLKMCLAVLSAMNNDEKLWDFFLSRDIWPREPPSSGGHNVLLNKRVFMLNQQFTMAVAKISWQSLAEG